MTLLSRRIPCSGHGTRVPVRVEDVSTGRAVAVLTAAQDGSWSVDVPAGRYRVVERWGAVHEVEVPGAGSFDVTALTGKDGAPAVLTPTREAPAAIDMARTLARHRASKKRREV